MTYRILLTATLSLIIILINSQQIISQEASNPERIADVRSAIDAGNAKWMAAFKVSDAVLLASIFTTDGAILVDDGQVIKGHEAIKERMGSFMKWMGPAEMTIKTIDVWLEGDMAYEAGNYEYRFTPEYEEITQSLSGKYLVIWKKIGDNWYIYRDIGMEEQNN